MESSKVSAWVEVIQKQSIRVLHVDDDQGFLEVAPQMLEMQDGFTVETALSVQEAKENWKGRVLTGWDACGSLRICGNSICDSGCSSDR